VTVGSDNVAGGHDATQHLISQGCRRMVFLGDPSAPEVAARLQGYRAALHEAGVDPDARLEVPGRFGSDAAYHAVSSLLVAGVGFDGVVACSDVFAMSAMRALYEHDRKVPADVAIVGFDDIPLARYTSPPLTTIRQDCRQGARLLVDGLLRAIRHQPTSSVVIPAELVVRASSLREQHRALPSISARRNHPAAAVRLRRSRSG
jgi:DNA-binding LacI/PurR family transcriptional regulator